MARQATRASLFPFAIKALELLCRESSSLTDPATHKDTNLEGTVAVVRDNQVTLTQSQALDTSSSATDNTCAGLGLTRPCTSTVHLEPLSTSQV